MPFVTATTGRQRPNLSLSRPPGPCGACTDANDDVPSRARLDGNYSSAMIDTAILDLPSQLSIIIVILSTLISSQRAPYD